MSLLDWTTAGLLSAGGFFFLAGTVGLLRFPDTLSRLHSLTKADNIGLGFVVAALAIQAGTLAVALKLVLIWLLALLSSAVSAYLIGGHVLREMVDRGSIDRAPIQNEDHDDA
jgi:multicomponent Na+:H+ antiporter subunit G